MTDPGPNTEQPWLWTEPVVSLVQPRKVAAGADSRFFDPSERLLGQMPTWARSRPPPWVCADVTLRAAWAKARRPEPPSRSRLSAGSGW